VHGNGLISLARNVHPQPMVYPPIRTESVCCISIFGKAQSSIRWLPITVM